jgi:hypothetical protein
MAARRPELSAAMAEVGKISPSIPEAVTRYLMEAGKLPRIKGRRTLDASAFYSFGDGAVALLGLGGTLPSDAVDAVTGLSILRAVLEPVDTSDPVGRLLPALMTKPKAAEPDADGWTEFGPDDDAPPINLKEFLTGLLANIGRLSGADASALRQDTDAKRAFLEMSVDPASARFEWGAAGQRRSIMFEYPGTPLGDLFGEDPPSCQTSKKLFFPLLLEVGRLLAISSEHRGGPPVPPSGDAPGSADPESRNAAPGRAASTRTQPKERHRVRDTSYPEPRTPLSRLQASACGTAGQTHDKPENFHGREHSPDGLAA